jgi:hypothetical protein
MKTKYPFQIESIIHKSRDTYRTFGMDANLFSPEEESESRTPKAPLEMHEGYSIFKGTLIAKDPKETKVVSFNIPARDVPYIHKKTTMAMEMALKNKMEPKKTSSGTGTGPAYTVKITAGTLKGKTPAQVLLEGNIEALNNQKKWLEDNLSKFKSNQTQIDAIEQALDLFKKGEISTDTVVNDGSVFEIYSCPSKNIRPIDERGYFTIYDVTISYDSSRNMPVEIRVNNCMAPVDKSKGNEIVMSKADNKRTLSMSLMESEWFAMIDAMKSQKRLFENLTYPEQLKLARRISKENRDEAKSKAD